MCLGGGFLCGGLGFFFCAHSSQKFSSLPYPCSLEEHAKKLLVL